MIHISLTSVLYFVPGIETMRLYIEEVQKAGYVQCGNLVTVEAIIPCT